MLSFLDRNAPALFISSHEKKAPQRFLSTRLNLFQAPISSTAFFFFLIPSTYE